MTGVDSPVSADVHLLSETGDNLNEQRPQTVGNVAAGDQTMFILLLTLKCTRGKLENSCWEGAELRTDKEVPQGGVFEPLRFQTTGAVNILPLAE